MINQYELILVTTHQTNNYIHNLFDSLKLNQTVKALLLLVSQEMDVDTSLVETKFNAVHQIKSEKIGLSKARNLALKYVYEKNIFCEYIMFPDDDSSFDLSFFENFKLIIGTNKNYIAPIYIEGTKDLYLGKRIEDNKALTINDYYLVGSPNQIIWFQTLKSQMFFGENLGVGAKYGSCEDVDLFIRLNLQGAPYFFSNLLYSYHPSKADAINQLTLKQAIARYKSYSEGFVFLIKKYKLFRWITTFLIRSIGGAIVSIIRLRFKMALVYFSIFFIRINLLLKDTKF